MYMWQITFDLIWFDLLHNGLDEKKLNCWGNSTNPVNVEEDSRCSVLRSKSGSWVTSALSISPENRNIWLLGTQQRQQVASRLERRVSNWRVASLNPRSDGKNLSGSELATGVAMFTKIVWKGQGVKTPKDIKGAFTPNWFGVVFTNFVQFTPRFVWTGVN
jgi:hypothetical protein